MGRLTLAKLSDFARRLMTWTDSLSPMSIWQSWNGKKEPHSFGRLATILIQLFPYQARTSKPARNTTLFTLEPRSCGIFVIAVLLWRNFAVPFTLRRSGGRARF